MIESLTELEKSILYGWIDYAICNEEGRLNPPELIKYIEEYNTTNGRGSEFELLNRHLYELIEIKQLPDNLIRHIVKVILLREKEWILINDSIKIEQKDEHNFGYIRKGNMRIDLLPDRYKEEREEHNSLQLIRLQNEPTNGKEYLK